MISQIMNSNKKVFMYGTSLAAVELLNSFPILIHKIEAFIESNPKKKEFLNKRVYSPLDFTKEEFKNSLVIFASSFVEDIKKYLSEIEYYLDESIEYLEHEGNFDSSCEDRIINGVYVGKWTYGALKHCNPETVARIGKFCSINHSAIIGDTFQHPLNKISTHPFLYKSKLTHPSISFVENHMIEDIQQKKTKINNDVWIGANAIILPGIEIGNGAVVGAGTVVTKDVPPYSIVVGVPAKVIKYRFNKKQISIIENLKWWEWNEEKIVNNIELFHNPEKIFGFDKKEIVE